MTKPVGFTLVVFANDGQRTGRKPHLTADVQCWRDNECILQVDLFSGDFELPDEVELDSIENFAVAAARAVGRILADTQMSRVEEQSLHMRQQIAEAVPDGT